MSSTVEKRAWFIFAAISAVALAAGLGWYFRLGHGDATYELRTDESVSGLIVGAPVEFHGVEVGQVRQVRLLDARTVQVLLRLQRDAPVSTATVATITGRGLATRGFTGYVYVSLDDVAAGGVPLAAPAGEPYRRIATAPSRSASLDVSIQQLNDTVRTVSALLQDTLDARTTGSLKATLGHLEQVSGTLASDHMKLRTILANAERASARLAPLLQSGTDAMGTLQGRVLPQARDTLARFDAVAGAANGVLAHADAASAGLVPLVQSGNAVLRSVQTQVLPETRQGLSRMNQALIKLDGAAARIEDNPSVLVWGTRAASPRAADGP